MSIIEPRINDLLEETDQDRFLLCALASKRAHDINDMMRGQRDRAIALRTRSRSRSPSMKSQLATFPMILTASTSRTING